MTVVIGSGRSLSASGRCGLPAHGGTVSRCWWPAGAGGFAGYWSRRITDEHRLVYKVTDGEVRIAACRYHYGR